MDEFLSPLFLSLLIYFPLPLFLAFLLSLRLRYASPPTDTFFALMYRQSPPIYAPHPALWMRHCNSPLLHGRVIDYYFNLFFIVNSWCRLSSSAVLLPYLPSTLVDLLAGIVHSGITLLGTTSSSLSSSYSHQLPMAC